MQYVKTWSRSERVKSCSRTWLPSRRWKLRTQPIRSDGSPFSISDSATTGCHAVWLLKSRSTAHTRSIGASITADLVTLITGTLTPTLSLPGRGSISPPKHRLERIERRLEHALADLLRQLALALRGALEFGPPLREGPAAVRHRRELQRGDVVVHAHR